MGGPIYIYIYELSNPVLRYLTVIYTGSCVHRSIIVIYSVDRVRLAGFPTPRVRLSHHGVGMRL